MSIRDTIKDNLINYWDWYTGNRIPVVDRLGNCDFSEFSGDIEDVEVESGEFIAKSAKFLDDFHYINSDDFSISSQLVTVSLWFRLDQTKSTHTIWWQGTSGDGQQLRISVVNGGDTIRFTARYGISNVTREKVLSPALDDGQWHHAVFSHSSAWGGYRCYLDNELVGTHSTSSNLGNNGTRCRMSLNGSNSMAGGIAEVMVGEFFSDDAVTSWLYNDGNGRSYLDIVEGNFSGVARFGSRAAKRVYALAKHNWSGAANVPVIDSTEPDSAGEYEMRLPVGDQVTLQAHAFEPHKWDGFWESDIAVNEADVRFTAASGDALILVCTASGTTGATEPDWPSSGTVADGSAEWEVIGRVNQLAPITNYYEVGSE